MSLFNNAPLQRKQTLLMMTVAGVALLLSATGFILHGSFIIRQTMHQSLVNRAGVMAGLSIAALEFGDTRAAAEIINSLKADSDMVAGALYDRSSQLMVKYLRAGATVEPPATLSGSGDRRTGELSAVWSPITSGNETFGYVYLESDLASLRANQRRLMLTGAAVLALSLGVAFTLATFFQRFISRPVMHLLEVANLVAVRKDFSLRASKQHNDELGRLVDGFNGMLQQIESRDSELQQARDLLEQRVAERTAQLRGEIIERKRQEAELYRAKTFMNSVIENLPMAVFIKEAKELRFVLWNKAGEDLTGIPNSEMIGRNDYEIFSREHADLFTRRDRDVLESRSKVEFPDELLQSRHRGARITRVIKVPILNSAGQPAYLLGIAEDVTERKKAEKDLADMNRRLLEFSRQAGQTEVATAVLHNVGNVLNSVNVSATLLTDHLNGCKTAGFVRVVALLKEKSNDLPAFFTHDPRAGQLTQYLGHFSQHLEGSHRRMLTEVDGLRKNIEHIKEVVAMQQSYAKVAGITEMIPPSALLADAVRMTSAGMQRSGIEVVQENDPTPAIEIDKNKALQILVNFLRNAKHACEDSTRPDKRVVVSAALRDANVVFSVTDNGVGIPADNLTRIFSHGFTTRKEGHGFGLHSGANAAREMGGFIRATSEGPGLGATFTLELPLRPPARLARDSSFRATASAPPVV
jgi:PAS domain S-box-containing protein